MKCKKSSIAILAGAVLGLTAGDVGLRKYWSGKQIAPDWPTPMNQTQSVAQTIDDDGRLPEVADLQYLRRINASCVDLVAKVRPAVVGVISPSKRRASGVIISPKGLVLSQLHVTHLRAGSSGLNDLHAPGEQAIVILDGGRECKAKLLGGNRTYDLSLLQITEPGTYPFVSLNEGGARLNRGDWVVKLGHPGGPRADSPAPARLGRILGCTAEAFVADCVTASGDSGGPYFDLEGQFAGIMNLADGDVCVHYSDGHYDDVYFMAITTARIASLVEPMKGDHISRYGPREFAFGLQRTKPLAAELRTEGNAQMAAIQSLTAPFRDSIVEVVNGEIPVGLATVVDDDGDVVAKATVLPPMPHCRLPDGSIVSVDVLGTDNVLDLAVMRLPTKMLRPILWASGTNSVKAGTVSIAVGINGAVLSWGIVSVGTRHWKHPHPADPEAPSGSLRSDDFTSAVEYSPPVMGNQSGGPLVDLHGRPLGIAAGVSTNCVDWAVSADAVRHLLARSKAERY